MLGILITLAVVAVVAYCVLKNYYPPIVLLLAGFVMLVCAAATGTMPVAADKSTNFFGFDLGEAFTALMRSRLPGLGLNIMLIAGFSVYMDRIGASKALVKLCVKRFARPTCFSPSRTWSASSWPFSSIPRSVSGFCSWPPSIRSSLRSAFPEPPPRP